MRSARVLDRQNANTGKLNVLRTHNGGVMGAICYLIHFDKPYKHARHYLGATWNLEARIRAHKQGQGSPLIKAVNEAGITWKVVRTWGSGFRVEKRGKTLQNNCYLCPICNPDGLNRWAFKRLRWTPRKRGKQKKGKI